ncbi:MAG: hypothetical protein LBS71_03285 [Puniceicoccales bacterium]|nr:hypothetical protein [Puniceicoccales bacterium]
MGNILHGETVSPNTLLPPPAAAPNTGTPTGTGKTEAIDTEIIPWTETAIKNMLKTSKPEVVCAKFSESTRAALTTEGQAYINEIIKKMQNHIEWVEDIADEFGNKLEKVPNGVKEHMEIVITKTKLMSSYFKDCFDELNFQQSGTSSPYVNCIKDLKEFQEASQNLRNVIGNISSTISVFILQNESKNSSKETEKINERLKFIINELQLADKHCDKMIKLIDKIITNQLTPLLRVFSEKSYEERNRGFVGTQTSRAL